MAAASPSIDGNIDWQCGWGAQQVLCPQNVSCVRVDEATSAALHL
jgi:hypothetical protein